MTIYDASVAIDTPDVLVPGQRPSPARVPSRVPGDRRQPRDSASTEVVLDPAVATPAGDPDFAAEFPPMAEPAAGELTARAPSSDAPADTINSPRPPAASPAATANGTASMPGEEIDYAALWRQCEDDFATSMNLDAPAPTTPPSVSPPRASTAAPIGQSPTPAAPAVLSTAEICRQVSGSLGAPTCQLSPAQREFMMRSALQELFGNTKILVMELAGFVRDLFDADSALYRKIVDWWLDRGLMSYMLSKPMTARTMGNVLNVVRPMYIEEFRIARGSDRVLLDLAFISLQNYVSAVWEVNGIEQLGMERPAPQITAHNKIKANAAVHLRDYDNRIEQLRRRGQPQLKLTQNNLNINIDHPSSGQPDGGTDVIAGEANPRLPKAGSANHSTYVEVDDGHGKRTAGGDEGEAEGQRIPADSD